VSLVLHAPWNEDITNTIHTDITVLNSCYIKPAVLRREGYVWFYLSCSYCRSKRKKITSAIFSRDRNYYFITCDFLVAATIPGHGQLEQLRRERCNVVDGTRFAGIGARWAMQQQRYRERRRRWRRQSRYLGGIRTGWRSRGWLPMEHCRRAIVRRLPILSAVARSAALPAHLHMRFVFW